MPHQDKEQAIERIAKGASSVTIAVVISRILGLVREQVLAYYFGASKSMDAFVVAYRIPNLLRDLFAEGASQAAFVKVFSSVLEKEGKGKALKVAQIVLSNFFIILGLVLILLIILAPQIVGLIAPSFKKDPSQFQLALGLTYLTLPFLWFISLSALLAGFLNSLGHFFWPALSSGFFNLSSIIIGIGGYYLLLSFYIPPIYAMAFGVSLGGLLQALVQLPLAKREGLRFALTPDFSHQAFRECLKLIGPTIYGLSVVQINIFINTYFATSCGEGAVSWYAYAFRVMYLPLGLFGVGITQALLPELTRTLARGGDADLRQAQELFSRSLVLALSLSIPSAVGLLLLSSEVISLLFQRGRFTPHDTFMTASLLSILSMGLPFYSLSKAIIPLFYSLQRTYVPALGSTLALISNLLVILLTLKKLGILAIALGTTASLFFQCLFLLGMAIVFLRGLIYKVVAQSLLVILSGSLLMALLILLLEIIFQGFLFFPQSLFLPIVILFGSAFYYFFVKAFGPKETYLLLDRMASLLGRPFKKFFNPSRLRR